MAQAIFYLIKEVGLNHAEIFGETKLVSFVEAEERDGVFGGFLDYALGKRKRQRTERVKTRGMSVQCLTAYLELLEEHQEEMEKKRKKQKMRSSVKSQTFTG
jgi:hypothetical protein